MHALIRRRVGEATFGAMRERIALESESWNTVQNATFCVPILRKAGVGHVILITSDFHMPRVRAIFEWVFALPPRGGAAELSYESVPERGLAEEAREARAKKEAQALDGLRAGAMARVRDLAALHSFVFQEHRAYGAAPQSAAAAATAAEERAQGALASTY